MASAFSHALVALALGKVPQQSLFAWRTMLVGMVCSVVPDLDVIGFHLGIAYGDLWGHRGLTHSLAFAAVLSAGLVTILYRRQPVRVKVSVVVYFFLCTASHGVLDAMTDGGLGVAFFSPFDPTRYFFPVRPVMVSPIGFGAFFTGDLGRVLASEVQWIWLPTMAVVVILRLSQRWLQSQSGQWSS